MKQSHRLRPGSHHCNLYLPSPTTHKPNVYELTRTRCYPPWWNIEMATDGEGFLEMPFFSWNQGVPNVRFEVRFVLQCRPRIVTNTDSLKKNGVSTMSCFKYSTIRIQSKWLHKPEFALFVSLYKSKWNLLHIVGIFNDAFKQLYNSWYIAKTPISLSPVSLTVHEVTFCLNRKANSSWRSSQN